MPVSVIVGGQYGSEGKGKIALFVAKSENATVVIRVGGPNSGHTGFDEHQHSWVLRQLPAAALAKDALIVLPAGSLIDPDILRAEVEELRIDSSRLLIDSQATVVLPRHREQEGEEGLVGRIGSTASGTGAALRDRISRGTAHVMAAEHPYLRSFTRPFVAEVLRDHLRRGERIVVEGTQGFGLSLWHGMAYPHATGRDTTAASFISEAGLAPHDVDDVVLVIRSFPIRVGGNSGPLENEIDWRTLATEAGLPSDYTELTSATRRVRRVARFHPDVVQRAVLVNQPHRLVMNHVDYVDPAVRTGGLGDKGRAFIQIVEQAIARRIDLIGIGPNQLVDLRTGNASLEANYANLA
jgi:adenylosuccinate synthase